MIIQRIFSLVLAFVFVTLLSNDACAAIVADVNTVAENITNSANLLPALLSALAYLSGIIIAATGVIKTIEHVNNPNQTPFRTPVIRFLIGGALFSLPIITEAAINAIDGGANASFGRPMDIADVIGEFLGIASAATSLLTDFNTVLGNVILSIDRIPALIRLVAYLLGLLMAVSALYYTRDHVEDPQRVSLRLPVIRFLIAGALFGLPTVYEAMYNTIADSGLGLGGTVSSLLGGVSFFYSSEAGVACSPAAIPLLMSSSSLGNVICGSMRSALALPSFLSMISYILGLIFGLWGVLKIRDHVIEPSKVALSEGISRLIAGGVFFAMPFVVTVLKSSTTPLSLIGVGGALTNTGFTESLSCSAANSLDQAMGCIMNDVLGPTHVVLNFFCFCAGMIFIMIGTSRLIRSAQEGAKGPGGMGTVTTFVVGGVLISATSIMRAVSSSLFGSPITNTAATLAYTGGMDPAATTAVYNVTSAVLKFMIIIGMISFVRGVFIMRDVAEGKGQASTMAGITHMLGGALAVNLGPLANAIQASLGMTGFGMSFGSGILGGKGGLLGGLGGILGGL